MKCMIGCLSLTIGLFPAGIPVQAQTLSPETFHTLAEQSRTAFTVLGAGARANGAGGAFIAVADDATAVSFNPAGLAKLLHPECSFVLDKRDRTQSSSGFTDPGPPTGVPPTGSDGMTLSGDGDDLNHVTHADFFSCAIPWKTNGKNRVLEFSYQRLFDLSYAMDADYSARQSASGDTQRVGRKVQQRGGIGVYSAGLGFELNQRFLVGASVNLWRGSWEFHSASNLVTSASSTVFVSTLHQDNDFHGLNMNLGVLWRSKFVEAGLVYRTPFAADYTFEGTYTHPDAVSDQVQTEATSRTTSKVRWPETFGFGLAWHPTPSLQMAVDWSRTPWSKARFASSGTTLDGLNFFDFSKDTATQDVTDTRLGLEWIAWLDDSILVPLRFGFFKEPQPIVDARTGQQRVYRGFNLGMGIKYRFMSFDLAYQEARSDRDVSHFVADASTGGFPQVSYGKENLRDRRIMLSCIARIDDESVRRALTWFFIGE
jgi:long-subunit fatty acid transport protein